MRIKKDKQVTVNLTADSYDLVKSACGKNVSKYCREAIEMRLEMDTTSSIGSRIWRAYFRRFTVR